MVLGVPERSRRVFFGKRFAVSQKVSRVPGGGPGGRGGPGGQGEGEPLRLQLLQAMGGGVAGGGSVKILFGG